MNDCLRFLTINDIEKYYLLKMTTLQEFFDLAFPFKCLDVNCDGKCVNSVKLKGMKKSMCSSHNVFTRIYNREGFRDFHLYWSIELNSGINPFLLALKSNKKMLV